MVGTKMTKMLTHTSSITVMMVCRIQLNSLEAHSRALTEVRICGEKAAVINGVRPDTDKLHTDKLRGLYVKDNGIHVRKVHMCHHK